MSAKFLGIRNVGGAGSKEKRVAAFSGEFGDADFVLDKSNTELRRQNRMKYGQDPTEENKALAALGEG